MMFEDIAKPVMVIESQTRLDLEDESASTFSLCSTGGIYATDSQSVLRAIDIGCIG